VDHDLEPSALTHVSLVLCLVWRNPVWWLIGVYKKGLARANGKKKAKAWCMEN
jgi:hypothetical protein